MSAGAAALLLGGLLLASERVCQSPDCLVVENVHSNKGRVASVGVLDTRLHLYVYVPPATTGFTLGVYDQQDETPGAKPSAFVLTAPDGTVAQTLDRPAPSAWATYVVATGGRWGVWRLSVTGPEDGATKARNAFMVRTTGNVDLYLKPEPVARARGLRLGAPRFGGGADHRFTVQVTGGKSLRVNLLYPKVVGSANIRLSPPRDVQAAQRRTELTRDDRLNKDLAFAALDVTGPNDLRGLWRLSVRSTAGESLYGLGIDAESRVFFRDDTPLMPFPVPTPITTNGGAARVDVSSPTRTANERCVVYTDKAGAGMLSLLPGVNDYRVSVSRGMAWGRAEGAVRAGQPFAAALRPTMTPFRGWYGGDTHHHTTYYDGTDTPAQMIEAARAAGLDWIVTTEHGHGPVVERAETVVAETAGLSESGKFVVVPGMEYTSPTFHANVLGAVVPGLPAASPFPDLLAAVRAADSDARAVTVTLNHPTIGDTAEPIARSLAELPLIELWNSSEPAATRLWWDLLNKGLRVFAQTGSDSHHRKNFEPGFRRTYVYLGDAPLTAVNIVRALRAGRSFLSRGALLDVRIGNGRPGAPVPSAEEGLTVRIEAQGAQPLDRVDIVCDGNVVQSLPCGGETTFSAAVPLPAGARWCIVQVWPRARRENGGIPLAMSNPIFVSAPTPGSGPQTSVRRTNHDQKGPNPPRLPREGRRGNGGIIRDGRGRRRALARLRRRVVRFPFAGRSASRSARTP